MTPADAASLVAVALLVGAAGVIGAAETVVTRLGLVRALHLEDEGRRGARALVWLLERPATSLNALLLLTVLVRVSATAILTAFVLRWLPGAPGVAVSVAGMVLASFVLAEVVPRSLTLRNLEGVGLAIAPAFGAIVRLAQPGARTLVALGRRLASPRGEAPGPFSADEELRRILGPSEPDDEPMEEGERAMIHSIFELGDTVVREIMVPRPDMVTVDAAAPLADVIETMIEHGYSRIPVHEDGRDHIVGVVYAKDALEQVARRPGEEDWRGLVRPPTFVPETKRVDDLLRELQEAAVHMALVVDEYGDLVGLATIEDVLEEIVGEIVDEYDSEEPLVETLDDGRLRVDGRLLVHELNELLRAGLPEGEGWDTVGGLLLAMLGRVPEVGETVELDGLTLVAEQVQGRRVAKVIVAGRPDEHAAADAGR